MFTSLCAYQDYFQWGISLTLTCNMRNIFGKKPIREWINDNECKCIFSIGIHTIFQHQKMKRAPHQSALRIFIRVWEEVGVIFIDYLKNIPSRLFLSMLAVFACKKYQSDVGNISHIFLLGNIFQLYEQSQTELFDLIGNNFVDIIKP